MRTRIELLTLMVISLLLWRCGSDEIPPKLEGFQEDYFNEYYRFYPTRGSANGMQQYDGRMDDLSALAIERRMDTLKRLLIRLQNIRSEELSPDDETAASVLDAAIRAELTDLAHIGEWRRNPLYYIDVPLRAMDRLMRRTYAPPSDRLRSMVIAVNEIDAVLAAMRANLSETPPPLAIAGRDAIERLLTLLHTDLPPWGVKAAGVDMRLASSIKGGTLVAIDSVGKSLRWVRDELAPSAQGEVALGPEHFVMKVLFDSLIEMRISELRQMAEEGVAKASNAFEQEAARVAPGNSPAQALRERAARAIPKEKLLSAANRETPIIYEFLQSKSILNLPPETSPEPSTRKYRFQLLPEFRRTPLMPYDADLPPRDSNDEAAEAAGILPLSRDGYLLVGQPVATWSPELQNEYRESLTPEALRLEIANELVPGRYTQALRMRDNSQRVVRLLASRVTLDGWANYSEQLLVEAGFENGDEWLRLEQLHRALVRYCRFLASVQMHTAGMTVAEAAQLFQEKAYLGPEMAAREARRISYDPLCLGAALGKELILKLRDDYRARKGAEYSPGAFHDEFLGYGGLPIPLIRKGMLEGTPPKGE